MVALLCLRLRCHVLEGAKLTVSPVKESPLEGGASSGQQELNTVVSSDAWLPQFPLLRDLD